MLDNAAQQLIQQSIGGNKPGGFGGIGGMGGMGGMPGGQDGPFNAKALTDLKTNPKIAKHLQDPQFRNLYDMCI